jgi:hypothetical protein
MKRILLLSVLVIFIASMSFGQMAYNKGDQVASLGIGLGGVAGSYGTGGLPISLAYEYGFNENISFGGLFGYASTSESSYYGDDWKWTNIIIGARGAYHLDLLHKDNIDTYGGIMLGYNIVSFSGPNASYWSGGSYIFFGGFIGGRYYFSPNLAAQVELGYGLGILNIGLAYKF